MGVKVIQTNFTAGVLDPLMASREDTELYYNGLASANNLIIQPVGGTTARNGFKKIVRLPKKLTQISLASATITAPNGGTAANIKDGDDTTYLTTSSNIASTNPFVIAHIDFGATKDVSAFDIINYKLSSLSLNDEIYVQSSSDNVSWANYGTAFNWSNENASRRRRAGTVSARYWRIVRIGSTAVAATASVSEVKLWTETSDLSAGRLAPFAKVTADAYMMVVTEQNIDIVVESSIVGSVSIPYQDTKLPVLNWTQSLDTMLMFHVEHQPYRLFQQGANDEFDFRKQTFDNIPKTDYGAGTGGINEIQVLNDGGTLSSGDKFTILLEGKRTTTITAGATRPLTAAAIQTALRNLENTSGTGITVVDGTDGFTVTFAGDDGNQPWQEMDVSVLAGNSVWTVSRTTEGDYPGEAIVSDARGWFRCGTFYQQRLYLGGAKSRPNALVASKVSEFYDLDINVDNDTAGLLFPLETNKTSAIFQIVAGRQLSIFTEDSEFYIAKEPIAADAVIKLTTSVGIREGIRVQDMDGALEYIQGDGASLREFIYNYDVQSIDSNNLSYKAGSLINSPVDMDLRKAVNADETDQLYIINADGTVAIMCALRSQSVPGAFTKISLDNGKVLAVGVDAKKRVYVITERIINGQPERFVEMSDSDYLLDCSSKITMTAESYTATAGQTVFSYSFTSPATDAEVGIRLNGGRLNHIEYIVDRTAKTVTLKAAASANDIIRLSKMVKTVTGVTDFDGETIKTIVDGTPSDDVIVQSGSFTLSDYADTSIEYGFDVSVYGELLPPRLPGQETLTGRKIRVPRVIVSLFETEGIEISVNNGPYREIPLLSLDSNILDKSQSELKFTGVKDIRGILGWGDGVVKFRRPRPGKMTIRTITREITT